MADCPDINHYQTATASASAPASTWTSTSSVYSNPIDTAVDDYSSTLLPAVQLLDGINGLSQFPRHSLHPHILSESFASPLGHPNGDPDPDPYASLVPFLADKFSPPLYPSAQPSVWIDQTAAPRTLHSSISAPRRPPSLTDAASVCSDDDMTAYAVDAPGSPPGLTGSKSSKSSSFHSSSRSGRDGILTDITHFEDIGLDEEHYSRSHTSPTHGMEKPPRPIPRAPATIVTHIKGHRGNAAAMTVMRELTNGSQRPPYPRIPGKGHGPTHSLSLPGDGLMRKSYRNASTPSLAIKAMSNCNRSRSTSPHPASPESKPVSSPRALRTPGAMPARHPRPPLRRGSWQPSRKSIKELEDEYNDEDDELPEDASLWNVPLSPRPPSERTPIADAASPPPLLQVSPKISPGTSPERPSPLRTSISAPSADSPVTAPLVPSESATSPDWTSPPLSPRKPKVMRGASMGTLPDRFGYQPSRSKSWSVVLSELSEEAKALTETLEDHALTAERRREQAIQSGKTLPGPSMEKLSRAKTSTVELPPLRLNNVMIDPLPISKEKEKVLTRTRPSWLPPKNPKEEKKHLKEYQRMMELSREADKRRAAQRADHECAKDDTKKALLRIWEEHVLPNWDQVIREPRTRELWWRGVAPKSRAQVWPRLVGNELALTGVSYDKALQRARDVQKTLAEGRAEERYRKERIWFDAIRRDVKTAFPELRIFQPGAPLHDGLVDVLMAYSMYRSDVGYSHGTHVRKLFFSLSLPWHVPLTITIENPVPLVQITSQILLVGKLRCHRIAIMLTIHTYSLSRLFSCSIFQTPKALSSCFQTCSTAHYP